MPKKSEWTVFDSVTGKTFVFESQKDARIFFDFWDKLVVEVIGREDER